MITKFHIFESNGKKKYFYHATKFEHLPYILKHGLTPNIDRKTNWRGELGEWSRGKVFVSEKYNIALDYGELINKTYSEHYFPILRILLNPKTLKKDHFNDFYSTEPITGYFEVKTSNTDNEWDNLKDYVSDLEGVNESINEMIPETIIVNGIECSTTNSKGQYISNTHKKIINFYKWFKNSKVVDKNGRPLVVYHGTTSNFDNFDIRKTGKNTDSGMWGKGFYFTNKPSIASSYSKREESIGSVIPVFLSLTNPYEIKKTSDIFKIKIPSETHDDLLNGPENYSNLFREKLIEKGYDGVIVYGFNNSVYYTEDTEYVAFYSNQIKSAIGNNGNFSTMIPNINEKIK